MPSSDHAEDLHRGNMPKYSRFCVFQASVKKSSLPTLTAKYISHQKKEEKPTAFLGFMKQFDKQEMSHTAIKQRFAYT